MKFDASRVESRLRELGDPRYAGADGEANVADFVAGQLAAMGLEVDRREVTGSRFPQRAAPWVGWLGYGFLITTVYALALSGNGWLMVLGWWLSCHAPAWIHGVLRNRLHPGRHRPPLESAPVLVATRPGRPPDSPRVVFQAVISGVRADPFHFFVMGPITGPIVYGSLYLFPPLFGFALLFLRGGFFLHPSRLDFLRMSEFLTHYVYPAFLVPAWIGIVVLMARECRHRLARARWDPPDRRGLALLLELAGTWPRGGARPIEPVFVVAGGQPLDYAGSREVVRLLKTEWASTPFLLILFFEPGAGDELWLSTSVLSGDGLGELAEDAARSLWVPYRSERDYALDSLWPFVRDHPALALMGSDPRAFGDDSVDPQALVRAAQLATEVALRWAKNPKVSLHPLLGG
jgi:hypothetical protein